MQSYQPDHYAILAAAKHDQAGFYQKELEYRRQLHYPPFSRLMRLEYRHRENDQAEKSASHLANQVLYMD